MSGSDEVGLEVTTAADTAVLSNLLELYSHDLSKVFQLELGVDARFGYEKLPRYWSERERRFAFLIRVGARLGCSLVAPRGVWTDLAPGTRR